MWAGTKRWSGCGNDSAVANDESHILSPPCQGSSVSTGGTPTEWQSHAVFSPPFWMCLDVATRWDHSCVGHCCRATSKCHVSAKCQAGYCMPIILYNPPNNPVKLYYNNVTDENAEAQRLIILLKAKELWNGGGRTETKASLESYYLVVGLAFQPLPRSTSQSKIVSLAKAVSKTMHLSHWYTIPIRTGFKCPGPCCPTTTKVTLVGHLNFLRSQILKEKKWN